MTVAADLVSLASEVGMGKFCERLNILRNIQAEWTGRTPATVAVVATIAKPATVAAW